MPVKYHTIEPVAESIAESAIESAVEPKVAVDLSAAVDLSSAKDLSSAVDLSSAADLPAGVERHPFEPFLPAGAKVLMLGSFPPQRKRWCMEFYYPNWLNDFWRICGIIFFGDSGHFVIPGKKCFDIQKIKGFCSEKGVALFDTATEVRRLNDNASDKFLEVVTPTDIPALLAQVPECRAVVTTGQKATDVLLAACCTAGQGASRAPADFGDPAASGKSFAGAGAAAGIAAPPVGGCVPAVIAGRAVDFWRMPSTSRAYPLPLDRKADAYRHLFTALGLL
jgi:G:T/U-mismatch repair DNA glycosylase